MSRNTKDLKVILDIARQNLIPLGNKIGSAEQRNKKIR